MNKSHAIVFGLLLIFNSCQYQNDNSKVEPSNFYVSLPDDSSMSKDYFEFKEWFLKNIKYPKTAEEDGITGNVYLYFEIDTTGLIIKDSILQGIREDIDYEVIRVIRSIPKLKANKQRRKMEFSVPIMFQQRKN